MSLLLYILHLFLYSEGGYDITNYPFDFTIAPASLNHVVTFNVTDLYNFYGSSPFPFICHLFDYERSQFITVAIQNGKDCVLSIFCFVKANTCLLFFLIRSEFDMFCNIFEIHLERIQIRQTNGQDQILNNSVINFFPIKSPPTKRSYNEVVYVHIACTTVIGDEDPVWLSDNAQIVDSTGEVVNNDTLGINVYQTSYSSELIFSSFDFASYEGTYMCQSRQSNISLHFYFTTGKLMPYNTCRVAFDSYYVYIMATGENSPTENPYLKFQNSPVIMALLGDIVNLTFKVAYDSTGYDDFSLTAGNITLEFAPFSANNSLEFPAITATILAINNYYFALGEVNSSYAGMYTVIFDSSCK